MESKNIKSIFSYKDVTFVHENGTHNQFEIDNIVPLIKSIAICKHAVGLSVSLLDIIMRAMCMGVYTPRVSTVHVVLRGEHKTFCWPQLRMTKHELLNNPRLPDVIVERFAEIWQFMSNTLNNTWSRMGPLTVTLHGRYESGHVDIHSMFKFNFFNPHMYDPYSPLDGQISIPDYPYLLVGTPQMNKKISIRKYTAYVLILKKAHNMFVSKEALPFITTVYNAKLTIGGDSPDSAAHRFGASSLFDKHLLRTVMTFLHM